jgi:glycosyltransferase involved in cell wall biosynthesis
LNPTWHWKKKFEIYDGHQTVLPGMGKMRKNLLIIFPDEWLAYAPTVLNIADSMSDFFNVRIIAVDIGTFRGNAEIKNVEFIKIDLSTMRLFSKFRLYKPFKALLLYRKAKELLDHEDISTVIGVDSMGLFVAQKLHARPHFLSLEIKRDIYFRLCNSDRIESVVIPNKERLDYLFHDEPANVFFLQNAPPFKRIQSIERNSRECKLIFFGHALPEHGILSCLDAMNTLKDKTFQLTIKGLVPENINAEIEKEYSDLLSSGKIVIDTEYLKQEQVNNYLSGFSIGFCLYNLDFVPGSNADYLISAPSGKLFNYYAAGVPVIGSDIMGLRSVREFDTGILLSYPTGDRIKEAIITISANIEYYRKRCIEAAEHFDFNKAIIPYREFLVSSSS